ncbi:MAG: fumarylacetoacetate hydrolase family protein [Acidobacteria bacterium]|nr:fumarylacetoacetate hydrolase family protein [Acidobacteriota bacterium]
MTSLCAAAPLELLARRMLEDYDRHRPGTAFLDPALDLSLVEAYSLQLAVAQLRQQRGERIAGYKVGCLNPQVQRQLGVDRPVFGHVFTTELHPSGAALRASDFDGPAVEGEFAVRVASDIASSEWLRDHEHEAIAGAFAVIELHNWVFRRDAPTAVELVANNCLHAGVVLGTQTGRLRTLEDAPIRVLKNGEVLGEAKGFPLAGGALESLIALVRRLEEYGIRLQKGQIVLTGTPLPLYPVAAGDTVAVESGDSEEVRAGFS